MRMSIDKAIEDLMELKLCGVVPFSKGTLSGGNYKVITDECLEIAIDTMRKYQKLQADYENRLKADMVAMLTDMKDELKHCEITGLWKVNYKEGFNDGVSKSLDVIQQKINELKAESGEQL